MAVFEGIFAKKFNIDVHRADANGVVAELQENGICSTDASTILILTDGQGDPNKVFSVDAGIIGTFQFAKKSRLQVNPAGVIEGVLRAKYTITWLIYGADFANILGGGS